MFSNNKWTEILNGIGGAIVLYNYNGQLFIGTVNPQSILRFSNEKWDRWDFGNNGEVSKFWVDSKNRLFTATTENGKCHLRQFINNKWIKIWSIKAMSNRWGPQGIVIDNSIILIFRDGNKTKVWKLNYII